MTDPCIKIEYETIEGARIPLEELDGEERVLLERFRGFLEKSQDWDAYRNFSLKEIGDFYDRRGVKRTVSSRSPLFRIAHDMGGRLALEQGLVRPPSPNSDYREQIEHLILRNFSTKRDFCKKTGISEDLLSHVLAGRKHLAIDTLTKALARLGYRLQIVPMTNVKKRSKRKAS